MLLSTILVAGSAAIVESKSSDNSIASGKARRLLKRFKKRKERHLQSQEEEVDVGLLSSGAPRFMEETDYEYFCPRETCPTELCDCAEEGGALEDCTQELQSVCRAGNLGDCVFHDYVKVYEEVYCPFVSCVDNGFRENQCDCAFYDLYCDRLHGNECLNFLGEEIQNDGPDKKPFFGCDESELQNVCGEADACKKRGDLQGLPELGTWKGSGHIGLPNHSNAGEKKSVGAAVVATASLFLAM